MIMTYWTKEDSEFADRMLEHSRAMAQNTFLRPSGYHRTVEELLQQGRDYGIGGPLDTVMRLNVQPIERRNPLSY